MPTDARDCLCIVDLNLSRLVEIQQGNQRLLRNWVAQHPPEMTGKRRVGAKFGNRHGIYLNR